jgi:hypothetical protein
LFGRIFVMLESLVRTWEQQLLSTSKENNTMLLGGFIMTLNFRQPKIVLKWWVVFCMVIFASIYAQMSIGLFTDMNNADLTKLSFLILFVFYGYMATLGFRLSKFCRNINNPFHSMKFARIMKHGWFISEIFVSIGFFGTLVGIMNMYAPGMFTTGGGGAMEAVMLGMKTALYTTVMALGCSIIMIVTLYTIQNDLEIIEYENDCRIMED